MNSRYGRQQSGKERKWDESAIVSAYEALIDEVGYLLDQVQLTGCRRFFSGTTPLQRFIRQLELLEGELLVQWKIFQENGIQDLFERQRRWLNQELRLPEGFFDNWNRFCQALWADLADPATLVHRDPWKSCLLIAISDRSDTGQLADLFQSDAAANRFLTLCQLFGALFQLDPHQLCLRFLNLVELGAGYRPDLAQPGALSSDLSAWRDFSGLRAIFADREEQADWQDMPGLLQRFWERHSGGTFSLYPAFYLQRRTNGQPQLQGVYPGRWIRFDELVGIESNLKRLQENTQRFLEDRPAQHVLLWGGRGTGKSSSVLALLERFVDRGLRLIELQHNDLALISWLSAQLKGKKEKFILFCDDLSFDQGDTGYRHLKSVMEGSLLGPAANLLFIATANRKDLVVRGEVDERYPEQKQLIDEKRAVDDRFGLKLYYETPVFDQLEKILFHYADRSGLPYDRQSLFQEFRRFALHNNHDKPAGRTVQQFIREWTLSQKSQGENRSK